MRFTLLAFTFSVSCIELQINSPWADTVWRGGQQAVIAYEVKPTKPDVKYDHISAELMTGDPLDGQTVSVIATDVPITSSNIAWNVPDYPHDNNYFIRIGSGDHWYFSHTFAIQGTGKTALPAKPTPIPEDKSFYANSSENSSLDKYTPNKAKIESNSTSKSADNSSSSSSNSTKSSSKSSDARMSLVPASALLFVAFLSSL